MVLPFQNDPWSGVEHDHSFFIFFSRNNKNSLTNKDFFILSVSTCIYSWRWNKHQSCPFHLLLAPIPPRCPFSTPRQAWQESTRAYCCVFDEVYRLFNDWWHIIQSRHHGLLKLSFCSEMHPHQACSYTVSNIKQVYGWWCMLALNGTTLEKTDFMVETPHNWYKRNRRHNWDVSDPFCVQRRYTAMWMVPEGSEEMWCERTSTYTGHTSHIGSMVSFKNGAAIISLRWYSLITWKDTDILQYEQPKRLFWYRTSSTF